MIELHPAQRKKICGGLRTGLADLKVEHGLYLHGGSLFGLFIGSLHHKPKDDLIDCVGDTPLMSFAIGYLNRKLRESGGYDADKGPKALTEFAGFEDVEKIADEIVDAFITLPWAYTFSMLLPADLSRPILAAAKSYSISDSHRVIQGTDNFLNLYTLDAGDQDKNFEIHKPGLLGYLSTPIPTWPADRAVFQADLGGFVGPFAGGRTAEEAADALKSFCGLGLALRLFRADQTAGRSALPFWYVHLKQGDDWILDNKFDTSPELGRALQSLAVISSELKDDDLSAWAKNCIAGISVVFDSAERGRNLLLAGRWLFEGYTGHDDLLNFVQCMIVLEILLGDESKTHEASLSAILGSRLAYAIAETRAERESLERQFRELYSLRGKIVHRGHKRLSAIDKGKLSELRTLCGRLIRHEVGLLQEEKKKEKNDD